MSSNNLPSKKRKHEDGATATPGTVANQSSPLLASNQELNQEISKMCMKQLAELQSALSKNDEWDMDLCKPLLRQMQDHKRQMEAHLRQIETLASQLKAKIMQEFLGNEDIWSNSIFPFVGPGRFIYVAGACRNLRDSYKKYVSQLENPPRVHSWDDGDRFGEWRPAEVSDTFNTAAFCSVSCAEFWDKDTSGDLDGLGGHGDQVCLKAAKIGSLPVLKWASDKQFPWDQETCANAAQNGHLEVLKWARSHGCKWNQEGFEMGA